MSLLPWPPPHGAWLMSDLPPLDEAAPTVLSTFSGGGGSSLGYRLAGYKVVGAVDISEKQCAAYASAMPTTPLYCQPVSALSDASHPLVDRWGSGRLDVLDGSPPCTLFSSSNHSREDGWGKEKKYTEGVVPQKLDRLFFDYLDVVETMRPKVFVAENVAGMLVGRARWYVREVVRVGTSLGYRVQVFKLTAASQGVPQLRKRLFFVGVRNDLDPGTDLVVPPAVERAVSVRDTLTEHTCGPDAKCRKGPAVRWTETQPARVCMSPQKGPVRALSVQDELLSSDDIGPYRVHSRDLMRVASFPDDYPAADKYAENEFITRQAVPPGLSRGVALAVRRWMGWTDGL